LQGPTCPPPWPAIEAGTALTAGGTYADLLWLWNAV
jgi:hypothetical protein